MLSIKILGSQCGSCRRLEENVRQAVRENRFEANIEKIEGIDQFIFYGIARIPALVINEQVVAQGMVLSPAKITELLVERLK
ncbi:MAG: hypothetical protein Kow0037_02580 [Calditrichia bacterium]